MRLENKIAVITGAGSGFGKGIAIRFAAEGAKVVIADINLESAEKVAAEIGEHALALRVMSVRMVTFHPCLNALSSILDAWIFWLIMPEPPTVINQ